MYVSMVGNNLFHRNKEGYMLPSLQVTCTYSELTFYLFKYFGKAYINFLYEPLSPSFFSFFSYSLIKPLILLSCQILKFNLF